MELKNFGFFFRRGDSVFDGADFRGVDWRKAIFNENTLLPTHK
jgi:uncharacterized protein YjbI with pentapeptide repeats